MESASTTKSMCGLLYLFFFPSSGRELKQQCLSPSLSCLCVEVQGGGGWEGPDQTTLKKLYSHTSGHVEYSRAVEINSTLQNILLCFVVPGGFIFFRKAFQRIGHNQSSTPVKKPQTKGGRGTYFRMNVSTL